MKIHRHPSRSRLAFTLIELILSLSVMSIVMSVMVLAVSFATRAIPVTGTTEKDTLDVADLVDQIAADLVLATSFVTADADTVEFTVPDRNHGAAGAETIHYEWSGTPGDPLILSYNGSSDITLCNNVHNFTLEYVQVGQSLSSAPRVLLVVNSTTFTDPHDVAREMLMESLGFTVQIIADHEPQSAFDAALLNVDVMYISETTMSSEMADIDLNPSVGLITEECRHYDQIGISQGGNNTYQNYNLYIVDNTHEITAGMGPGSTRIFSSSQYHAYSSGALAPDARVLSQWPGYEPTTVVVEAGGELLKGVTAKGRRVALPWGFFTDISRFDTNAVLLVQRSIEWAAATSNLSGVRIILQVGPDTANRFETQVQLLNQPEMP